MKAVFAYLLILVLTIFTLFVIKSFEISYPLTVINTTRSTELAVVGEGKVDVVPDKALIEAGITVSNTQSVAVVQQTINEINNKIIAAMKNLGIEKSDIKTSNYSISPNYSYEDGKSTISGYNGNVTLSIKTKNIQLVSRVIEEATKAGANQIFGAKFIVDKPETYREQARNKAIENARQQAKRLASSLGIDLGRVVNMIESSPNSSDSLLKTFSAGVGGAAAPEIEPGTQTVTSIVTLYFEKK